MQDQHLNGEECIRTVYNKTIGKHFFDWLNAVNTDTQWYESNAKNYENNLFVSMSLLETLRKNGVKETLLKFKIDRKSYKEQVKPFLGFF